MNQVQTNEPVAQRQEPRTQNGEQRIPMSYAEFLTAFDESTRAEWTNGEATVFMPTSIRHQEIVVFLVALIDGFVKIFGLGKTLTAPCQMRLEASDTTREPDIMFLAASNFDRLAENRLNGPADLVIEVISTESVSRDRSEKFYEYQLNGVREYWIIDPRPGVARADFWVLDDAGTYRPVPIEPNGIFRSSTLPDFKLNVTSLLMDTTLNHIQALIEMIGLQAMSKQARDAE